MRLRRAARRAHRALLYASIAHARWEYQVSCRILESRWRRIVLAALVVAAAAPLAAAVAWGDDLPPLLGGRRAYAPALFTGRMLLAAVGIGLAAGLITGCIGAGGGFVITPAMMSAGVKGIMAVGTDMFHIFAKAIMGTVLHRKMGNVSLKLAAGFVVGSAVGVTLGAATNRALYMLSPTLSDAFISLVYALLLGFLGVYALGDFLRLRRRASRPAAGGPGPDEPARIGRLAAGLQAVRLPPTIAFDENRTPGGRRIWAGFVGASGLLVGFAAAIMGVGGGFLTFPVFVYVLGVSEPTTVGTDILQIIFTAGYGSVVEYAVYGYVFYTLAMGLLLGSLLGVQVGAYAARVVPPLVIRGFYAMAILAGFFNRLMALPRKLIGAGVLGLPKSVGDVSDLVGLVLFFAAISVFAVWVIATFLVNIRKLREA